MERSSLFRTMLVLIVVSAVVFLASAVGRLWGFMGDLIMVFFAAWVVGSLLMHAVNELMRVPHMTRPSAIFFVYLILGVAIAAFGVFVIPSTIDQIQELAAVAPDYLNRLPGAVERVNSFLVTQLSIDLDLPARFSADTTASLNASVTTWLEDNAVAIVRQVGSAAFAIALVVVLSFYVVLDGGRRTDQAVKVLPPRLEREVRLVFRTFDETFHGYMRGMLLISLIYGISVATVMLATGLPAALPAAILASLLLVVPFIGDWLALALPLIIAGASGDFVIFLIVLATLLFVQQVMLNLLTPRILGRAVRMPAILVLMAVVLGARLAGVWGALLGVPASAVIYTLSVTYGNRIIERRAAREAEDAHAEEEAPDPVEDSEADDEVEEPNETAIPDAGAAIPDGGAATPGGMPPIPAGAQNDPSSTDAPKAAKPRRPRVPPQSAPAESLPGD